MAAPGFPAAFIRRPYETRRYSTGNALTDAARRARTMCWPRMWRPSTSPPTAPSCSPTAMACSPGRRQSTAGPATGQTDCGRDRRASGDRAGRSALAMTIEHVNALVSRQPPSSLLRMLPPLAQNTSTTPISEPPATTPEATGKVNSSASFGFRLATRSATSAPRKNKSP
jgi:hypothetical protein